MKSKTTQTLLIIHIIAWIIFIGLCIKTGAILCSVFVSFIINPEGAKNLYLGLDLSALYHFDIGHYIGMVSFIIVIAFLKAYIFYLVIRIFLKINLVNPFSKEISLLISGIGDTALGMGILTLLANSYYRWLEKKGMALPDLGSYLDGAGEFLMLGGIIFIIAQVYKKGIEIQTENDLTI